MIVGLYLILWAKSNDMEMKEMRINKDSYGCPLDSTMRNFQYPFFKIYFLAINMYINLFIVFLKEF